MQVYSLVWKDGADNNRGIKYTYISKMTKMISIRVVSPFSVSTNDFHHVCCLCQLLHFNLPSR